MKLQLSTPFSSLQHTFIYPFIHCIGWYYVLKMDENVILCAGSSIQITSNYTSEYSFIQFFVWIGTIYWSWMILHGSLCWLQYPDYLKLHQRVFIQSFVQIGTLYWSWMILHGSLCWLQYQDYLHLKSTPTSIHSFIFVDWYYVLELDDSVVLCAGSSIQITSNYTNMYSFIHLFLQIGTMFWSWMTLWFSVLAPVFRLDPTTPTYIHSFICLCRLVLCTGAG